LYLCVTGLSSDNGASHSLTANWNKSQSNCKDPLSKENNLTDKCELHQDTVKTGIWTNIFRVQISVHVDHGNTFYNNKDNTMTKEKRTYNDLQNTT
jgi:hypothetical protein